MKKYIWGISILLFISCSDNTEQLKSIMEFEYPVSELKELKTFVFQNPEDQSLFYRTAQVIEKDGKEYRVSLQRDEYTKYDSIVSLVDEFPKLLETFQFSLDSLGSNSKLIKGKIELDEYYDNNTAYAARKTSFSYESDNVRTTYTIDSEYKKDTTYVWKGETLPAIVIENTYFIETSGIDVQVEGESAKATDLSIYAKGLGLVKAVVDFGGQKSSTELIEIR